MVKSRDIKQLSSVLHQRVGIGSLVIFRISFGLIMVWEAWRYIVGGMARYGYSDTFPHFPYDWFPWVTPLAGDGMLYMFGFMGGMGLCMALGLFYRVSALLFTCSMTYLFLIDKANYLNHLYLVCLLGMLMIFIPAHKAFSLDARRGWIKPEDTAPAWSLWLLRLQLGVVYVVAGVAKIKYDWLIAGQPMGPWLAEHADVPIVGPLFLLQPVVLAFAWGGTILDLLIFPALLWRKTRLVAAGILVLFHLSNAFFFDIGIFPWLMLAATTLFFDPNWPHRWGRLWPKQREQEGHWSVWPPLALWLMVIYFAVQIFLPLRHYLIPGDVNWTKEGSRFAWRMKLNRRSGYLKVFIESDQMPLRTELPLRRFLNRRQVNKLKVWPDMVHDLALMLEKDWTKQGHTNVRVYAESRQSLNGRPSQHLFDPSADLTEYERSGWLSHQPYLINLGSRF